MDRTKGIGGSDIAAILGISPWKTAYDVYLDKVNEYTHRDESEFFAVRHAAQGVILKHYEEYKGVTIEQEEVSFVHPEYSFLLGNVDAICENGKVFVEAKTTIQGVDDWSFQIPDYYQTQVAFYAALGNADYVDVPVAHWFKCHNIADIQVKHFNNYTYWRNLELEKMVIDAAVDFWETYVLKRVEPPIRTLEDIKKRYGNSENTEIVATPEIIEKVKKRIEIEDQIADLAACKDALTFDIQAYMEDNAILLSDEGKRLIFYKTQSRTSFDSKLFKKEHPELYPSYVKQSTSRPFKLINRGL